MRCGWLAPSPAVRSGGKEADLLRASNNVNKDDELVLSAPLPP
jgi:hypothetical protein